MHQRVWGIRVTTTVISGQTAAALARNYGHHLQRRPVSVGRVGSHVCQAANTTLARPLARSSGHHQSARKITIHKEQKQRQQHRQLSNRNNGTATTTTTSIGAPPPPPPQQQQPVSPPYTNILPLDLVLSSPVRSLLPLIGHGAYLMIVSGFLMTDMLQLRLVLAAGYTNLVVFHALHPRPLRIPLGWSAMFVLVNASYAALLLMDQYAPGDLTAADAALYEHSFKEALTMGQFYQLLKLAARQTVPCGTVLSEEGQPCDKLYFIEKGSARLYHQGTRTAVIEQGGFVNDVAFSRGLSIGAYGTAVTDGGGGGGRDDDDDEQNDDDDDGTAASSSSASLSSSSSTMTTLLVWDARELKQYLQQRPAMDRNMKYLLSEHLVKSLLRQRDGTRERAAVFSAQQQQQQQQQQVQQQQQQQQQPSYWTWLWGQQRPAPPTTPSAQSGPAQQPE